MRSIGWSLPVLAMSILSLNCAQARAQEVLYLQAADWIPTASVLTMPTSYMAAGAYVFPTSYASPTVYATAYLTESALVTPSIYLAPSYYETRFRRRGLFGRRLVETSRAYYFPTMRVLSDDRSTPPMAVRVVGDCGTGRDADRVRETDVDSMLRRGG